ncbi:hypothetical protein ACS0TY_011957 [Phlomoides rotata]
MVGNDDVLNDILDKLTGQQFNRQIIPIVGMGGIGKTTLAMSIYANPLIVHHFDVLGCVAISQEYKTVFGKEDCPLELEEIGKTIAKNCKGLPLSIIVIGGLLRKSKRTRGYWEYIARLMKPDCNRPLRVGAVRGVTVFVSSRLMEQIDGGGGFLLYFF